MAWGDTIQKLDDWTYDKLSKTYSKRWYVDSIGRLHVTFVDGNWFEKYHPNGYLLYDSYYRAIEACAVYNNLRGFNMNNEIIVDYELLCEYREWPRGIDSRWHSRWNRSTGWT